MKGGDYIECNKNKLESANIREYISTIVQA